jgi:hypothetical protein
MLSIDQETNTKSNIILIPTNKNQYSLKQNFFDPTKSSPPNIFMIKLYSRMINYENKQLHCKTNTLQK